MILIADDHPLLLLGLKNFLNSIGLNEIITAQDGLDAYNLIVRNKPKIAILDIKMPKLSGLEVAKLCQQNNIDIKIVLITLYHDEEFYIQAKTLDVSGYLFKQFALEEIDKCIKAILNGDKYWSPNVEELLDRKSRNYSLETLTTSEIKILKLIAKEYTTPRIAEHLFISTKTVEKHRSNIIKKLEIDGKTNSLLIWAKNNQNQFT